jgi:Xaa-Pro dipeptidase
MSQTRLERFAALIQSNQLDGVVLNPSSTLTYLTGMHFHLMERPTVLIVVPGKMPVLVLPALEVGKLADSSCPLKSFTYNDNPATWASSFQQACAWLDLANPTIGVEPNWLRFLELSFLQSAMPTARFVSAENLLSGLRIQKDADEVALMRKAVQIAQEAYLKTLPSIKVGATEREIAAELSVQLLKAGADGNSFDPIIASGPNSANSHAVPTDRKIQPGDLIVIDWGAIYQGYISDLTRTVAIAPVDPELAEIARIVQKANEAGRSASRPGVAAGTVDHAARDVITQTGYGPLFRHRTGHGIGMETHEPPYMFGDNDLILAPGMTFTVEPGIYIDGRGGVRIEDNMLITVDGAETLSDLPRELQILA